MSVKLSCRIAQVPLYLLIKFGWCEVYGLLIKDWLSTCNTVQVSRIDHLYINTGM
jgi:hypothetical protein